MEEIRYANQNKSTQMHCVNGVTYITFRKLSEAGVIHGFSTRLGGVSRGYLGTMNLSFHRGDDPEAVMENHRRLAAAIGYDASNAVFSDQVHETRIRSVTREDAGKGIVKDTDIIGIDGLVTDCPGIPLVTFYADCVPLFFYDPVRQVAATAHSGWRGTVAGMGAVMIDYMKNHYGCRAEDIVCAIGPSICGNCYEISQDVADAFQERFPQDKYPELMRAGREGHYDLDLWKANQWILQEAGIRPEHLDITDLCTCCNPELLFSHRASHGMRGNLAAVIMLPERSHHE